MYLLKGLERISVIKRGEYDVKPGHQGNASVIVCFSITNLQIAGHPGGREVL